MFERIAARLESMDERLERMVTALEDTRNISGQPF
jgi:exonuclease VII small subunit